MSNKTSNSNSNPSNRPPRFSNDAGATVSGGSGPRRDNKPETSREADESGGGGGGGHGGHHRHHNNHNHHHRNQKTAREPEYDYDGDSSSNVLGQEQRRHHHHQPHRQQQQQQQQQGSSRGSDNQSGGGNRPRSYRKMHEMTSGGQPGEQRSAAKGRVQDRNYSKAKPEADRDAGGSDEDDEDAGGGGGEQHNETKYSFDKSSRRQLLSVSSNSGVPVATSGVSCICCLHDLHTYVYYQCTHFVCLNCAIKMRVLCQKLDCPTCRQDSRNVICTKKSDIGDFESLLRSCTKATSISFEATTPKAALFLMATNPANKTGKINPRDLVDYGICFDDDKIRREYEEIIENKCAICSERFARFDELDQHMRRVHKRFYCELCLEHLKLFAYERKFYDSGELGRHRRVGDQDDYSFKGHPRCEHCDQRFFDRDELYRHYRKEHYYCHFCDSDGHEEYYSGYEELRKHFLKFHFLCELDGCSANAAQTHEYVVFRSEIDFQAHKKEKHAKSRNDAKALAKLNIEFSINDSGRVRASGYGRGSGGGGGSGGASKKAPRSGAAANVSSTSDDESAPGPSSRQRNNAGASAASATATARPSGEQFEHRSSGHEDDRKKKNLQKLREKYENYEQNLAETAAAAGTVAKAPTSSTLNPIEAEESDKTMPETAAAAASVAAQPAPTMNAYTWSIRAGSGGVKPTISNTEEFPGLGAPTSLAAIGATIAKASAGWATSAKPASKSGTESQSETSGNKKQPSQQKLNLKLAQQQKNANKKSKILSESSSSSDDEASRNEAPPTLPKPVEEKKSPQVAAKSQTAPPPGFAGLESKIVPVKSPPPGFVAPALPVVDQFPALTTTASASATPPSSGNKENEPSEFLKPKNYDARNAELSMKLFRLFDGSFSDTEFDEFKLKSMDFRLGKLSGKEYMKKCHQLLGLPLSAKTYPASTADKSTEQSIETHKKFVNLIQEMIVLLPDSKKQNDLYKAFEPGFDDLSEKLIEMASARKSSAASRKAGADDAFLEKCIARCQFCPQFFTFEEMSDHEHRYHKAEVIKQQMKSNKAAAAEQAAKSQALQKPKVASAAAAAEEDFPSLAGPVPKPVQPVVKNWAAASTTPPEPAEKPKPASARKVAASSADEFPALGGGLAEGPRFSSMPTPNLFANPNAHLSLVNKKKHRLMK